MFSHSFSHSHMHFCPLMCRTVCSFFACLKTADWFRPGMNFNPSFEVFSYRELLRLVDPASPETNTCRLQTADKGYVLFNSQLYNALSSLLSLFLCYASASLKRCLQWFWWEKVVDTSVKTISHSPVIYFFLTGSAGENQFSVRCVL